MGCLLCGNNDFDVAFRSTDNLVTHEVFNVAECKSCGFHYTLNAPGVKEIERYYQSDDYISHTGGRKTFTDLLYNTARRIMLNVKSRYVIRLTGKSSGRLLDIGAGTGHFVNAMVRSGWKAEGVEVNESARNNALIINKLKLKASIEEVSGTGQYDAVTLWHVLEHIHDPDSLLKRVREILKDDGVLVIAVPNLESADAKYYRHAWAALDVPRHLWHFNRLTLTSLLMKHRFFNIGVSRMPFDSFYIPVLSEKKLMHPLPLITGLSMGFWFWMQSVFRIGKSSSLTFCFSKETL